MFIDKSQVTHSPPKFCPVELCIFHDRKIAQQIEWYKHYGHHFSECRGYIPRYQCRACGKTCSSQTFSIHYWTHSTIDMEQLDKRLQASPGQRQVARELGVTHNVIANRELRLARNYLSCFDEALKNYQIQEDCCFDGFESYIRKQHFVTNFNILIGKKSQMPYGFTVSQQRRKGRMTKKQKWEQAVIDEVWPPKKGAFTEKIRVLFDDMQHAIPLEDPKTDEKREGMPWIIVTDESKLYPLSFRKVPRMKTALENKWISHETVSAKAPRTKLNPLFSSNYIDRELRKNLADHVRETVRQGRELYTHRNVWSHMKLKME